MKHTNEISATFNDELDNHAVTIFTDLDETKDWKKKRTYFELYQSDRATRVHVFYEVLNPNSASSNPKNDFIVHDRKFSYQLADAMYRPNLNLREALIELADIICSQT